MAKQLNVNLAFNADTSKAKAQIQELYQSLNNVTTSTAKLPITTQIQEAQTAAIQLKTAMNQAFDVNTGKLDLLKFNQSIKSSGTSLDQIKTKLVQIGPAGQQAFLSLAQSIASAEIPAKRTSALLTNLGVTLKNTIKWQLSSSMLHGFMGTIQSAYGYAQNLNSSLNDIRIVTGLSAAEMDKFAEKANKAAKSLSSTTLDYTNASLIYFQQGLNEKEVEERTNVTLKMANASGATAEKVSQQMTAVWNNFDDGSKSLEYYADVMTALGAATASSTDEISQGLQKFSAVASTVGLSYEYATSALATITATTRESADVVGTALKTLFARIQGLQQGDTLDDGTTLNKYSAALDKVGISIKDANGQMKDMDIILDEMGAKWKTLEKDQQLALAQTVAGVRQYTQLVALMDNWDFFEQNLGIANNAEGTLQEQADIYAESWEAARKRVKAAAEAIYTDLLDDKFFIGLTNSIEKVLTMFDGFLDSIGGARGVLLGLSSILLNAFSGAAAKGLENMVYNFKSFVGIAQKEAIATQIYAGNLAASMAADTTKNNTIPVSNVSETTITTMQSQLQLTQAVAAAKERLNSQDQMIAEAIVQQNRVYGEQIQLLAQKADAMNDQKKFYQDELKDALLINEGLNVSEVQAKMKELNTAITFSDTIETQINEANAAFNNGDIEIDEYKEKLRELAKTAKNIYGENSSVAKMLYDTASLKNKDVKAVAKDPNMAANARGAAKRDTSNFVKTQEVTEETSKAMQAYVKAANNANKADIELAQGKRALAQNLTNAKQQIENLTSASKIGAETIVKTAQAMSSLAFGINSLSRIPDIFSDNTLSGGQKFLQIMTAVGTGIPMMINGLSGLGKVITTVGNSYTLLSAAAASLSTIEAAHLETMTAEQVAQTTGLSIDQAEIALKNAKAIAQLREIAGTEALIGVLIAEGNTEKALQAIQATGVTAEQAKIILDKLKAGSSLEVAMAEAGLTTTLWGQVAAWLGLKGAMAGPLGMFLIIGAAIAVLVGVVWGLTAAWKAAQAASPEGQLKAAKEEAKSLADSLKEAQQASQDLKDSFDDYDSAVSKLAECTEGTIEWQQALHEVNGEVLDLLNKYPELASMTKRDEQGNEILGADGQPQKAITKDEKGNLKIEDWAREQMIQESQKAINNVQGAKTIADQRVREAQIKVDTNDLAAQIDRQARTTAITTIQGEEVDMGSQVARFIANNAAEFQGMSPEKQAAKLSEVFGQYDLDLEGWTSAIAELSGPMNSLIASIDANTAATRIENETLVSSALADNQQVQDSAYTSEIIKAAAWNGLDTEDQSDDTSKYQAVVDAKRADLIAKGFGTAGINKATGVNDRARDDFAEYAKAAGITDYDLIDTTGTDKNRNFVYTDADGQEITVSLNKMIDVLANQEAQKQAGIEANKILDSLTKFEITDEDQKNLAEGLLNSGLGALTDEQKKQAQEAGNIESLFDQATLDNMRGAFEVIYGDEGADKFNTWLNSLNQQIIDWKPEQINLDNWKTEFSEKMDIAKDLQLGDTISSEDYTKLGSEYAEYFTQQLDGTYQLTVAAKDFADIVNDIETQKLKDSIENDKNIVNNVVSSASEYSNGRVNSAEQIDDSVDLWQSKLDNGATEEDAQRYLDSAVGKGLADSGLVDLSQYDTAIEKIQALSDAWRATRESLSEGQNALALTAGSLAELNQMYSEGNISQEGYSNGLVALGNRYENCNNEIANYQKALESNNPELVAAAFNSLQLAVRSGELGEESGLAAEEIEDMAKQMKTESKYAKASGKALAELAKDQLRYNRGLESAQENMKDWKKALADTQKGVMMSSETMNEMADAYGDILDIDGSQLSADFLKNAKNLENMEKAINGDVEAYEELQQAVQLDLENLLQLENVQFNGESIISQFDAIESKIAELPPGVDIAAELQDEGFLQSLSDLVNAAGMTADQATSYLSSMGIDATVVEGDPVETEEVVGQSTTAKPSTVAAPFSGLVIGPDGSMTTEPMEASIPVWTTETEDVTAMKKSTGVALEVTSASKSSGGNVKHSGSGGGKKSGGGGGGGKKSEKKKMDKVAKSDVVKRYKKVDDKLDDKTAAIDKASRAMDKLYGASRIKSMQKYNQLLQEEIGLLEAKAAEAKNYLEQEDLPELNNALKEALSKAGLSGLSFEIDEDGLITNYQEIMTALYNELDKQITAANNAGGADEDQQKKIEELQEKIDAVNAAVEQYDETRELIEDLEADMAEKAMEIYDNQLEALSYSIELNLEISDDSLALIDFQLSQIEDDAFKAAEAIALMGTKAATIEEKMAKTREALSALTAMTLDGEYTEEQMELIKQYRDELMNLAQEYMELRNSVEEQVMSTFEAWREEMDKGISTVEHYGSVLESYKNITDLLGKTISKSVSDDLYAKFNQGIVSNSIDQIEATKAAYKGIQEAQARAKAEYDAAIARGDEASAEMWKKTLSDLNEEAQAAQEAMLSAWESALSVIAEQFEESVERAVNAFREQFDDMSDKFSRSKETSDMFLKDYQQIYELSKLSRDINNSIDDTESLGGKKKLKGLLEEINKLQEDGVEMSQYDLEYLQKTYDLRLAEIELENAQNAKNTVRLSKDNEGNWSYVYTTNTDAVDQAQQKYEDALYSMQDLSSTYIDEMSEKLIATSQEMAEALASIRVEDFSSYQEYQDKVNEVMAEYQTQMELQEAELDKAIGNNKALYEEDWSSYNEKTGYKISKTNEFVTSFRDSLLGSLMDSTTQSSNFMEVLSASAQTLVEALGGSGKEYFENIGAVMNAAGTSTDAFGKDATDAINATSDASKKAAEDVKGMANDMVDSFNTVSDSVVAWQKTYSKAITEALEDTESLVAMINAMNASLVNGTGVPTGASISTGTSDSETDDTAAADTSTEEETDASDYNIDAAKGIIKQLVDAGFTENMLQEIFGKGDITASVAAKLAVMDENSINIETLSSSLEETLSNLQLDKYENYEDYLSAINEIQEEYQEALQKLVTGQVEQKVYENDWQKLIEQIESAPEFLGEVIPASMLPTLTEVIEKIGANASQMSLGVGQWAAQLIKDEFLQTLEQEVNITADFPNVSDHNEIEEAIRNLINTASQYANRK